MAAHEANTAATLIARNREVLNLSGYGPELNAAYDVALSAVPALADVEIVSSSDELPSEFSLARAIPGNPANGLSHRVCIRTASQQEASELSHRLLDTLPSMAQILRTQLRIDQHGGAITPSLVVAHAFLHELRHARAYMEHGDDLGTYLSQMSRDLDRLPYGRLPVSVLLSLDETERDTLERTWLTPFARIADDQHRAYRSLPAEAEADGFASDLLLANHGQLLDVVVRAELRQQIPEQIHHDARRLTAGLFEDPSTDSHHGSVQ